MDIELDLNESLHKNASLYFEKSKKAYSKAKRIEQAIKEVEAKIAELKQKKVAEQKAKPLKKRPREWYEKFHWFFSSDGFLVLAGKDAKTNELLIKRYMQPEDIYFHADIQGAAHCIVKTANKKVPRQTKKEAAIFAAVYSKAWQQGLAAIDVYSVKPEQVSKKAPSGEALGKGAFMIYGKREWFKNTPLDFAIGVEKVDEHYRIISGPAVAIQKHAIMSFRIIPGSKRKSDVAKVLKSIMERKLNTTLNLDEIIAMLPADNVELAK